VALLAYLFRDTNSPIEVRVLTTADRMPAYCTCVSGERSRYAAAAAADARFPNFSNSGDFFEILGCLSNIL
jgi:hypothetical protein